MPPFDTKKLLSDIDNKWIILLTSPPLKTLLSQCINDLLQLECDVNNITPHPYDIFNAFRLTSFDKMTGVILGQDPYPGLENGNKVAHGLSFSSTGKKIPASLRNIYKCLLNQKLIKKMPTTPNLSRWADQGILLLNASLTTIVGNANAHAKLWKPFTDELIKQLSYIEFSGNRPFFMLWGNFAKKKSTLINPECKVYTWLHPSPLAQGSAPIEKKFINCDHFATVNHSLSNPIDWTPSFEYTIYTDGSCKHNGKGLFARAGYAVYIAGEVRTMIYGRLNFVIVDEKMIHPSSQRAEGVAILTALEYISKIMVTVSTVNIVTDSNFWTDMINKFMPSWEKKNMDFKKKKNYDLTIKIHKMVKYVNSRGQLNIIWMPSHNKEDKKNNRVIPAYHIKGNALADKYAKSGMERSDFRQHTLIL